MLIILQFTLSIFIAMSARDHEHVHLVGGGAAASQEYLYELCEAICRGVAAQKKSDMFRILYTLPMGGQSIASLSSLCQEATYVMSDKTNGWPGPIEKPIGNYPYHWPDGIHELDGHALGSTLTSRGGEAALYTEMNALMVQNGIEYAEDDVSGASLDPTLVRQARDLEMKFFNDMSVCDRVPRSQLRGKLVKSRWIDFSKGISRALIIAVTWW